MQDNKLYFKYWGKASKEDGSYHLLPYHCLDVAAVGHVLLHKIPGLKKQLACHMDMDEGLFTQWISALLALHDLGKFTDAFQKLRKDILILLQERDSDASGGTRHDTLGYFLWREHILPFMREIGILRKQRGRSVPVDEGAMDAWMRAATGHHGVPPEKLTGCLSDFLHRPDDIHAAKQFVKDVFLLFLDEDIVFPDIDLNKADYTSWWIAGFIVLCDWLGSSREPDSFSSDKKLLSRYWNEAVDWADGVVEKSGLLPAEVSQLFALNDLFEEEINAEPTPLQAEASKCTIGAGPQLFILEDVTGAGKTEAAVLLLHQLMAHALADGTYFALPTMATSNSMYRRMGKVYRKLYVSGSNPSCVLAHSAREMSEEFRKSIKVESNASQQDYGDGTMPATAHCSAWLADNRKKALLADIGVGTVDQALLSILPSRHQSLRLLGLLGKVLVIDEVHSADSYQNILICDLLTAHASMGGCAILLSATLPQSQRRGFLHAFATGLGIPNPTPKKIDNADYPLLTHFGSGLFHEKVLETRKSVNRTVEINFVHNEKEVYQLIKAASEQGRCVCWIRNTVKDTRAAHKQLQKVIPADKLDLFHARYAMQDRLNIEMRVLDRFGPDSEAKDRKGQVLISSPVTEQSLDLCFDVLVSDLTPIDLIIQRAGRLQRHIRDRAGNRIDGEDQRGGAVLYVHAPQWSDTPQPDWLKSTMKGTAAIYEAGQLWLTQKRLRQGQQFRMPHDARSLIEAVYGKHVIDEIPDGLLAQANQADGDHFAIASHAKSNALELAGGYRKDGNWWDEDSTPTRYVEKESIRVYLAKWENGHLQPWIDEGDFRWARSAVSMMRDKVTSEGEYNQIPAAEITKAKETMPAKGNWGVLLPLIFMGEGLWQGRVKNKDNQVVKLYYDSERGLMEAEEMQES